jgi:hypothetical protein
MNQTLEQMIDSSAAFACGLRDMWERQGRCTVCPNAQSSKYVSLKSWYENQPELDVPYWMLRRWN